MKEFVLFMFCCLTIFPCCKVLNPDENLTLQRKDYTGDELKTDGYYYVLWQNDYDVYTRVYFLYRNGIVLSIGHSYPSQNLDFVEKEILQEKNSNFKTKDHWGIFIIDNNAIQYEKWVGSTGFRTCLSKSTGYIKNDTTIHFTDRYYSETNKTLSIDEVWHFKSFSPKPDSTNNFIK